MSYKLTAEKLAVGAARRHMQKFLSIVGGFEDRGMLNSEMLCVVSCCKELGIEVLIESGRFRGQSTEILAKFFLGSEVEIHSIELLVDKNSEYVESKMKKYPNIKLLYGDSAKIIAELVETHKHKRIAILFDGPKGKPAIDIFRYCLTKSRNILVGFFHDMRKPSDGMPNTSREVMDKSFVDVFYTDDEKYDSEFGIVDKKCLGLYWKPFELNGMMIGSYGPTLATVVPSQTDLSSASRNFFVLQTKIYLYRLSTLIVSQLHNLKVLFRT